ncbi:MAG: hypothetical protein LBI42_09565 [Chitinispirillales bacterium]|jgi:hypothetical protein|nr:hypothetical protein [Chitinispirillales bacterium]
MLTKEQIKTLIENDPHFVELIEIHFDIRETRKCFRDTLTLLRNIKHPAEKLDVIYDEYRGKEEQSELHIENVYGVTRHDYGFIEKELNLG